MRKSLISLLLLTLALPLSLSAQEKERERLQHAGNMMQEILNIPDGIPKDLLDRAECVVVLPSVKKFAIGIGGSFGRGVMVCRSGEHFTGSWGSPAMYALEGGNIGFQLGGQATDFILSCASKADCIAMPSSAMASRPASRATALFIPEAAPDSFSLTEPMTVVVNGATLIDIPSPRTKAAGKNVFQ